MKWNYLWTKCKTHLKNLKINYLAHFWWKTLNLRIDSQQAFLRSLLIESTTSISAIPFLRITLLKHHQKSVQLRNLFSSLLDGDDDYIYFSYSFSTCAWIISLEEIFQYSFNIFASQTNIFALLLTDDTY